ncbi:CWF19-like protein 2 [Alosa sapidissima]|uniref:CWF19-like protein 2 n=1 Tax=Alosa sapidissima TaxID=34773 RepID=UPI001C096BFB|nr:CWF19-like protein 2 [Alosa sapidissima]
MAAYGGSFESTNNIEARKEFKRRAREEVVQKAKEKYEQEERRKELKRARGEDTWMLPDVDHRLQQLNVETTGKSKKKKEKKAKKSKKEKKEKKKAKKECKKAAQDGSASDSSEASADEWVEAQPTGPEKAWKISSSSEGKSSASTPSNPADSEQRDEWMTFDFLAMKTTSIAERRAEKERLKEEEMEKARAIEEAGLHKLELNPYWKDGGKGLPPEEGAGTAPSKAMLVNDGGLSWLRKSYQRMKEQAEREQRSLEAVVSERYGSMEEFQQRLQEAEKLAYGERSGGGGRGGRGRGGGERGWDRERWRRGVHHSSNSRDRRSPPTDQDRDCNRERDRDDDWGRDCDRDRDGDRGRGRDRDGNWRRDRENDGDRSDRGRGEDRAYQRDWRRDRDRDREDGRMDRGRDDHRRDRDEQAGRSTDRDRRPRDDPARPRPDVSRPQQDTPRPGRDQGAASLKARFLKPSDPDEDEAGRSSWGKRPSASKASSGFMKPSDDDDDGAASAPAWRKNTTQPNPSQGKQEVERGVTAERRPQTDPMAQTSGSALVEKSQDKKPSESPPSSQSEEEEEEEEEEDAPILTDEEMNKLGAKLVKAELMGNTALADKIKAQLEAAREAKERRAQRPSGLQAGKAQVSGGSQEPEEVVLFRTDHSGRAWPVNAPSESLEPREGRRKKKAIETHRDGERVRYFHDDDGMDLQEMVRREKMSSAEDQNALYSRMAAKMMGKQDGDNYTLDDMFVSSAAQRERSGVDEDRQRSKAIHEHRRLAARMDKCPYCFDNPELPKHLIVAIGAKVYLCLPNMLSLTEGHCIIAPLQHHCAATGLDEDVWTEMQMFRRALVKMFEDQDQDCVFMETHMSLKRRMHMVYECVPLPKELGDMAPIYFKKAIMESDEEWAMNKKVVDLSQKNIRQAVPKGLPYFSVDFGLQGGFAHVIENEQKFPHYFGKEILGGMMDLEPRRWRKPIRENFDDQRKKVLQFAQWWKPFDCTKTE